jgi:plastocyanin
MRRTPHLLLAGALALALPLAACGDDDTTADPPAGDDGGASTDSELTVKAKDNLTFDKAEYEAAAGEIAVVYENEGSLAHTLLVKDVDGFKLAVGDTDEGTVDLEPGTYELYCDVAGHGDMKAELTVE